MPSILHRAGAFILITFGVVHFALTPFFYPQPTVGAAWFAWAGLAMIFIGLFNLAVWRAASPDLLMQRLCLVANLGVTWVTVYTAFLVREPQAIAVLVAVLLQTGAAFGLARGGSAEDTVGRGPHAA